MERQMAKNMKNDTEAGDSALKSLRLERLTRLS